MNLKIVSIVVLYFQLCHIAEFLHEKNYLIKTTVLCNLFHLYTSILLCYHQYTTTLHYTQFRQLSTLGYTIRLFCEYLPKFSKLVSILS
jgi:hypothetical protein